MIDLHEGVLIEFTAYTPGVDAEDMLEGFGLAGSYRDLESSPGLKWLKAQGIDMSDHGDTLRRASQEYRAREQAYRQEHRGPRLVKQRAYYQSSHGKKVKALYRASAEGKASRAKEYARQRALRAAA